MNVGQRAMLVRQPSAQAYGMVYALSESEIDSLYSESGLEMYHPEVVMATFEDGSANEVTMYNLEDGSGEPNREYATKLRLVLERLGFPTTL